MQNNKQTAVEDTDEERSCYFWHFMFSPLAAKGVKVTPQRLNLITKLQVVEYRKLYGGTEPAKG